MKKLFILMSALFIQGALASEVTELKSGDLSLSPATAKITDVRAMCPTDTGGIRCMAFGSIVTVKITLGGCMDNFGGYFSKFEVKKNKGYLFIGAINIFNKASMVTRCVQAPTKLVKLHVPFEGSIKLVEMEYMGGDAPQF